MFSPPKMTHTLRACALLIGYPDASLRGLLPDLRLALHDEAALSASRLAELDALIDTLQQQPALDGEAAYVELFDRGRSTSLHLFEHVHGDSRDRGPAMIDLAQTYEKAGLFLSAGELPDYLPVVLEFASTQPPKEARAFLAEMAHILNALFTALVKRESRYASVVGALIELAGERAHAVKIQPDEALDDSWAEPLAFDGCSSHGQAKPGAAQPIHLVRKSSATQGVQP
ncbi:nitrate reductase molybdenum cofactor assembly chaperone [Methyloversatilis discipulorum]|jgi:nitrate reductase molybdenum cofactor assembly chaperone NarJ/NarW|uniref:nitrate reductase molybdenum cofactor assembly chaperone n=1 Tax=Methyloversatilis discipulorum TaxID=1119528 RepID=UPI00039A81E0|nr:nitrate reductase molybdenum cofactor assembly chaperone [Methyloversatilis discipulorum]